MTYKVFRYVDGENKSGRAWTKVEAGSVEDAIRKAADKKGVRVVKHTPKVGNFPAPARWVDASDTSVSFGASPAKVSNSSPRRIKDDVWG